MVIKNSQPILYRLRVFLLLITLVNLLFKILVVVEVRLLFVLLLLSLFVVRFWLLRLVASLLSIIPVILRLHIVIEFVQKVFAVHSAESVCNVSSLLRLVPEEELPLFKLLLRIFRAENLLHRVRMISGVPSLGAHGHWGRSEVLNLLQMEVEVFRQNRQFCHVFGGAARVTAYEVRNNLLVHSRLLVYLVEDVLEFVELCERRLAHQIQNLIRSVLWSYL